MSEKICKDCKATETKEDLYQVGDDWLCTLCLVKFLDSNQS